MIKKFQEFNSINESVNNKEIQDYLKANFKDYLKGANNKNDTDEVINLLSEKFPKVNNVELSKIAKDWTGYKDNPNATHEVTRDFTFQVRSPNSTLTSERGSVTMNFNRGDQLKISCQSGSLGDLWRVENLTSGKTGSYWTYDYKQDPYFTENVTKI